MKTNMIIGIALALATLSVGTVSASSAGSCCGAGSCGDKQAVQQFTQETAGLTSALKAKDSELRELNGYDSFRHRKAERIEGELKGMKENIKVIADKHGISSCCISS